MMQRHIIGAGGGGKDGGGSSGRTNVEQMFNKS